MEKVRRDPASLSQLVKDFDLEVVYKGLDYDTRMITIPDVNRPACSWWAFMTTSSQNACRFWARRSSPF